MVLAVVIVVAMKYQVQGYKLSDTKKNNLKCPLGSSGFMAYKQQNRESRISFKWSNRNALSEKVNSEDTPDICKLIIAGRATSQRNRDNKSVSDWNFDKFDSDTYEKREHNWINTNP